MKLGEKLRYLRFVEGTLRGLNREMTQAELARAIAAELSTPISQAYLSQIESGARPHLTNTSRMLLAKFFNIHPGYLVDDPEGFHQELTSPVRALEDKLDLWLIQGGERFHRDPALRRALLAIAASPRSRECLLLLHGIVETPQLAERLFEILAPVPAPFKTPGASSRGKAPAAQPKSARKRRES